MAADVTSPRPSILLRIAHSVRSSISAKPLFRPSTPNCSVTSWSRGGSIPHQNRAGRLAVLIHQALRDVQDSPIYYQVGVGVNGLLQFQHLASGP